MIAKEGNSQWTLAPAFENLWVRIAAGVYTRCRTANVAEETARKMSIEEADAFTVAVLKRTVESSPETH